VKQKHVIPADQSKSVKEAFVEPKSSENHSQNNVRGYEDIGWM